MATRPPRSPLIAVDTNVPLDLADRGDEESDRDQAQLALRGLARWNLDVVNLVPAGHGIVERIADHLQEAQLLPVQEYNDGLILAEAALLGCAILLSGDARLRSLDFQRASPELKAFDVEMPVVATPREIVAKFC
jgi:hypothetical protein